MTDEETRGRKQKKLVKSTILEIVESHDEILTTQEIRRRYNNKEGSKVAWETVSKNLSSIDELKGLQVSNSVGWIKQV